MVRELGQPWQKKTGAPPGSPYSLRATVAPFARIRVSARLFINQETKFAFRIGGSDNE
jgi:hypothetical protein